VKKFFFLLGLSSGIVAAYAQPAPKEDSSTVPAGAYLRVVCGSDGDTEPKVFGEWPEFQPALRLISLGGSGGEMVLTGNLLPLSCGAYIPLPLGATQVQLQEKISVSPEGKETWKNTGTAASLAAKPGLFFTLLIVEEGKQKRLQIFEDPPAPKSPPSGGESLPEKRSLRCVVLEPGVSLKIFEPGGRMVLEAAQGKVGVWTTPPAGIIMVQIRGQGVAGPFEIRTELDFSTSAQKTIFVLKNIYGKISGVAKDDSVF